jgi:leader peptidase (prepilin peptidase)/N-methyltransferase
MSLSRIGEAYLALFHTRLGIAFVFVLGTMVGSFLNVVIARLPAGESIVRPRSHCPICQDSIPWYLNVPVLSYVLLRGRCRACKTPISPRYPIVELLTGLLFVAALATFGPTLAALTAAIYASGLVVITFVDIDIWEIPDEISIPGLILGSVLRPLAFDAPWYDGLVGALVGACSLALIRWVHMAIRKVEGMGLGDVKLIGYIGAFVGLFGLLPTILVASTAGSVIGVVVLAVKRLKGEQTPKAAPEPPPPPEPENAPKAGEEEEEEWEPPPGAIPFGPFLALGGLAQMYFGPLLLRWFHRIVG